MQLKLINSSNQETSDLEVSDKIFACKFNEPLVHQLVTAYLAAQRQGTSAQKNRADVSGSGKKPWKQKGTGRARSGSITSPIWRKGGVTFAGRTQSYAQRMNKKMYRLAMRCILSELIRQGRLKAVESFSVDSHKTRDLFAKLRGLALADVMVVTEVVDQNLYLASRNLPNVVVCEAKKINPVNLVKFNQVLMTKSALKQFEEILV